MVYLNHITVQFSGKKRDSLDETKKIHYEIDKRIHDHILSN